MGTLICEFLILHFLKNSNQHFKYPVFTKLGTTLFIPVFIYTSQYIHGHKGSYLSYLPCLILKHMAPLLTWWFHPDIFSLNSHMYVHRYSLSACMSLMNIVTVYEKRLGTGQYLLIWRQICGLVVILEQSSTSGEHLYL